MAEWRLHGIPAIVVKQLENESMSALCILQTVITDYREPVFLAIHRETGGRLTVWSGETEFSGTIHTIPDSGYFPRVSVENRFPCRRSLLWQRGVVSRLGTVPFLIAEFNLRSVSTWLLLRRRRRSGLPTVLWGHASGRRRWMRWLRWWMFSQVDGFVSYTETQAAEIRRLFPRLRVWAAPNAIMSEADCRPAHGPASDVLWIGRLVAGKKPELAIRGFVEAVRDGRIPREAKLLIVGDGPLRDRCEILARELGSDRVEFFGKVTEAAALRAIFGRSLVALSTGYVGLSATQAFGHGVPMLIARDEPHSPEIEACREGFNSRFFPSDDAVALGKAITSFYLERDVWQERREAIAAFIRENYTVESMARVFADVFREFGGE